MVSRGRDNVKLKRDRERGGSVNANNDNYAHFSVDAKVYIDADFYANDDEANK